MIKAAIEKLLSLRDVEKFDFNGHQFTNKQLVMVPEDKPSVFFTKTLASLVELIIKECEHENLNDLVVHVESPTKVFVLTTLRGDFERFNLYSAVAELPNIPFEKFLEVESINILLRSSFAKTELREALIATLGSITEENITITDDDGLTQKVTMKQGIRMVGNEWLQPIVSLAPFRTFLEVEQPISEFLLRVRTGPDAALFEADGGAWKIKARKNIKAYFEDKLSELVEKGKVVITE